MQKASFSSETQFEVEKGVYSWFYVTILLLRNGQNFDSLFNQIATDDSFDTNLTV